MEEKGEKRKELESKEVGGEKEKEKEEMTKDMEVKRE